MVNWRTHYIRLSSQKIKPYKIAIIQQINRINYHNKDKSSSNVLYLSSIYVHWHFNFRWNSYRPSEIIIYIIGGITYEESLHVHMMNKQGARIVLGGSYVHNFSSFMDQVMSAIWWNLFWFNWINYFNQKFVWSIFNLFFFYGLIFNVMKY